MGMFTRLLEHGDGQLAFRCPGCKQTHTIQHGPGKGPRWGWNGDVIKPTFTPSVLVRSGHYAMHYDGHGCWCSYYKEHPEEERDFECVLCHSFVTDGLIQFLSDSTHALAGQTVELPPWETTP